MYQSNNNTDWIAKEKRELFCKYVNTAIMSKKSKTLNATLKEAKKVVDRAFETYPDYNEEQELEDNTIDVGEEKWDAIQEQIYENHSKEEEIKAEEIQTNKLRD